MKEWFKKKWSLVVSLVINIALCLVLVKSCTTPPEVIIKKEYIPQVDTVYVPYDRIVEKTVVVDRVITDTCYIEDGDTVEVTVPIEQKVYQDVIAGDSTETEIMVAYHGAFADIDSIDLKHHYFNENTTIIKEKKSGFGYTVGVGPYIGFGAGYDMIGGKPMVGPEVGIAVQVTFGYSKIIK